MSDHDHGSWKIYAVYDLTRNRAPLGGVVADTLEEAYETAARLHRRQVADLEVRDTGRTKPKKCC
jgi:hypothetical protein